MSKLGSLLFAVVVTVGLASPATASPATVPCGGLCPDVVAVPPCSGGCPKSAGPGNAS
ncbi:hypothetical protein [Amycolatopsis sp. MtRt-6]|uniref:hypothetical protein n=1 Tax=Amycolatopsis sp. MtRt-6 TaxID=2792782 RepID=UPI001A8C8AA4|nr:hypothetical protein [Amycolatopsis sp. MtRt-6]